jgi:hypothetical protein
LSITARREKEKEKGIGNLRNPIIERSVYRRKWALWIIENLVKVEKRSLLRGVGTLTQIAIVAAANQAIYGLHVCLVLSTLLFQR